MNTIVNLNGSSVIQPDPLPIALRAYVPPPTKPNAQPPRKARSRKPTPPSEWTLVFDTETTVDAAQRLRVGAYQFRKANELDEFGLFYDPALIVSEDDLALLRRFCRERGYVLRTVAEFIDEVLFARAYDLRASIVGFNLPFDISRLAIRHGSARGKAMRGGFHVQAVIALVATGYPSPPPECSRLADAIHASTEAAGPSWTAQAKHCPQQSARVIH